MTGNAFICLIPNTGLNSTKRHRHHTNHTQYHSPLTLHRETAEEDLLGKRELCWGYTKWKNTGQRDLTASAINLIQSNPIHLIKPISASVNGLEVDLGIAQSLEPNRLSVKTDINLRASEACQEASIFQRFWGQPRSPSTRHFSKLYSLLLTSQNSIFSYTNENRRGDDSVF